MTKVVIVGGAGFIGANAAASFLSRGDDVTVLDNFSRDGSRINAMWLRDAYPNVRIVHADVRSDHAVLAAKFRDCDLVLHEAAQVAVTTSVEDPRSDFEINALGTFNVLEALRSVYNGQSLIFASTNKVYGGLERLDVVERSGRYEFETVEAIPESEPLDFHSPYGCSKGAAEQYVRDYARIYGLRTVVFRQSCIYGPHQFGLEDQGWVAWFSICASLRRPVTIFGDGKQIRDVLHVQDLVRAYQLAHDKIDTTSGNIYNVGGGPNNTLSLLELISLLDARYGRRLDVSFSDWRPGDQRVFVAHVAKAAHAFGWRPETKVSEGVDDLCSWIDGNQGLFTSKSLARI